MSSFLTNSTGQSYVIKDPRAVTDYTLDWAALLGTDTIQSVSYTVPVGLTLASSSNTTTQTTVWLSGGTLDEEYKITTAVSTTGGRIVYRSFYVFAQEE